eukprot:GFUD01042009.1.p1 GENE.GFUD01042009.1~~GFUD01042009.1.p1  ORF type:complete len:241 (-),score=48.30 GFUD01042009.1:69-791(-)
MSPEVFNLSWNDFEKCTVNSFKDLLEEDHFVDVTLVSEDDKQIKAHKVVLSACSPVLKHILVRNPHQHPLIYLTGVKYQELKSLMNFMYLGQAEVGQEDLNVFMSAAEKFQIKGFSNGEEEKNIYDEHNFNQTNDFQQIKKENGFRNFASKEISSYESDDEPMNYPVDSSQDEDIVSESQVINEVDGGYKCDRCNYVAKRKDHLKPHVQAKHDGIQFPCDMCSYKATFSQHLNRHKRNQH